MDLGRATIYESPHNKLRVFKYLIYTTKINVSSFRNSPAIIHNKEKKKTKYNCIYLKGFQIKQKIIAVIKPL